MVLSLACEALLFDLDGVLVDSGASVERHWAAWGARRGIALETIRPVMHGRRTVDTLALVAPELDAAAEALEIDGGQARDGEGVRAIDGAPELLAALPPERWGVVTSGPRMLAVARLGFAGLPSPRVLVTGDEVEHGKPDPAGYLLGARRLGVDPAACAIVEDAPAGVAAGRAAGMRAIGQLTSHAAHELRAAGAELLLESLAPLRVDRAAGGALALRVVA